MPAFISDEKVVKIKTERYIMSDRIHVEFVRDHRVEWMMDQQGVEYIKPALQPIKISSIDKKVGVENCGRPEKLDPAVAESYCQAMYSGAKFVAPVTAELPGSTVRSERRVLVSGNTRFAALVLGVERGWFDNDTFLGYVVDLKSAPEHLIYTSMARLLNVIEGRRQSAEQLMASAIMEITNNWRTPEDAAAAYGLKVEDVITQLKYADLCVQLRRNNIPEVSLKKLSMSAVMPLGSIKLETVKAAAAMLAIDGEFTKVNSTELVRTLNKHQSSEAAMLDAVAKHRKELGLDQPLEKREPVSPSSRSEKVKFFQRLRMLENAYNKRRKLQQLGITGDALADAKTRCAALSRKFAELSRS